MGPNNLWKDGWENTQAKDNSLNELKKTLQERLQMLTYLKELGSMSPSAV